MESINLNTHWVVMVMDQYTRRIIAFSAFESDALTGANVCAMLNKIIGRHLPPRYISSDNDPLFQYHQWKENLRIDEIKEIKTIPFTPVSHPFVERVIGTIRREYLDHVLFTNATDLEHKLKDFQSYYNQSRQHQSLQTTPNVMAGNKPKKRAFLKNYFWKTYCRGFFQTPIAA